MKTRGVLFATLASVLVAAFMAAPARTQAQQSDAKAVLKAMSDYVSSQKTIEVTFDSDIEVITPQLEKIQFTNSGEALLSRPDKLRAHRAGGYADVELFFDGKTASDLRQEHNGYAQVRCSGHRGPADRSPEGGPRCLPCRAPIFCCRTSTTRSLPSVMEAKHIGRGVIDGVECEHLAFRNFDTDWQLWVEVGGGPSRAKW